MIGLIYSHSFLKKILCPSYQSHPNRWLRNSTEIRKRKNDMIDSILITDLLRYGDFIESSFSKEE
ncbi:IS110 family transposase [Fusobacterium necrophorum]|uniref:IS110 family transposase n=1 Tax=Fusobacterium necrophorum TaxID=859 RepID=UPI001D00F99C|nr:IS110 family transposase [Fusobacterium necrophorum]